MKLTEQNRFLDYSISHDPLRAVGWLDQAHYLIANTRGDIFVYSIKRSPSYTIRCPFPIEGRSFAVGARPILLSKHGLLRLTSHLPPRVQLTQFQAKLDFPYFLVGKGKASSILTSDGYLYDSKGGEKRPFMDQLIDQEITACVAYGAKKAIVGTRAGTLLLVDILDRKLISHHPAHASAIADVVLHNSDLYSIGRDGQLIKWVIRSKLRRVSEKKITASHFLNRLAFWKNRYVIADAAGCLHIADDGNRDEKIVQLYYDSIRTLDINHSQGFALTDSDDGTVALFDLNRSKAIRRFGDAREYIRASAPVTIGQTRAHLVGTSGGTLTLVLQKSIEIITLGAFGGVRAIEDLGDGIVAVGFESGRLCFLSVQDKRTISSIQLSVTPYSIRHDPIRKRVLVGLRNGRLAIFGRNDLKLKKEIILHRAIVGDIYVARDFIITCSDDGTAKLCEPTKLRDIHTIAPNIAALNNIAVANSTAMFTSDAGYVLEFSLDRNAVVAVRPLHDCPIRAIALTTGGLMATGDRNGLVCFWDTQGKVGSAQFNGRVIRLTARGGDNVFDVVTEHEVVRLGMHPIENTVGHRRPNSQKGLPPSKGGYKRQGANAVANVLHLSDLHFLAGNQDAPALWKTQLEEDLVRDLHIDRLDGIVLSGDLSTSGIRSEFNLAAEFLSGIMDRFHCPPSHLLIIPGNHDIDWSATKAGYVVSRKDNFTENGEVHSKLETGNYVEWISNVAAEEKLRHFRAFYADMTGRTWAGDYPNEHCELSLGEGLIYCAGLNSAWRTDHLFPKRISINPSAFAHMISRSGVPEHNDHRWRVLVIHHPIGTLDDEKLPGHGELEQLCKARFNLILHGHIHKPSSGRYDYDTDPGGRHLKIIGAGTFGAATRDWAAGFPLGYNLLRFQRDRVVVETRKREVPGGAWRPDARWTDRPDTDPSPRYEIMHPQGM